MAQGQHRHQRFYITRLTKNRYTNLIYTVKQQFFTRKISKKDNKKMTVKLWKVVIAIVIWQFFFTKHLFGTKLFFMTHPRFLLISGFNNNIRPFFFDGKNLKSCYIVIWYDNFFHETFLWKKTFLGHCVRFLLISGFNNNNIRPFFYPFAFTNYLKRPKVLLSFALTKKKIWEFPGNVSAGLTVRSVSHQLYLDKFPDL